MAPGFREGVIERLRARWDPHLSAARVDGHDADVTYTPVDRASMLVYAAIVVVAIGTVVLLGDRVSPIASVSIALAINIAGINLWHRGKDPRPGTYAVACARCGRAARPAFGGRLIGPLLAGPCTGPPMEGPRGTA